MKVLLYSKEYDLEQLSATELKELRLEVEAELDNIKDQLNRARVERASTGKYADPDWYWSATRAMKHKQRDIQAIQVEQGKRSKDKPVSQYFVDVAFNTLEREVYNDIMTEAKMLKESEQ